MVDKKAVDDLDDLIRQEREKEKQNKVTAPMEVCVYILSTTQVQSS